MVSRRGVLAVAVSVVAASVAPAQDDAKARARFTLYGRAQADGGYDFGRIDSTYADRLRTSKLPTDSLEFGRNGRTYFSARPSRIGLKTHVPTELGEIFTIVELDFIGSGPEAGQTMPRLRHAYGEVGWFGAGQYWSTFVDVDVHPAIVESFGPTGLPWVRNVQFRWMPLKGATRVTLALEQPGASGEGGDYDQLIELEGVQLRFHTPEWAAAVRRDWKWGHARVATLLRKVWWDDSTQGPVDLSGDATGWGVNLTGRYKFGGEKYEKDALLLQYLFGEGVENYIKDNTVDVAPRPTPDPLRPIVGVALPVKTFTGYVEAYRGKWGGVAGYSMQDIHNSEGQEPDAFAGASYVTVTAAYYPIPSLLAALEYQYGRLRNFSDGWRFSDHRLQLTARYSFSADFRPQ